MNHTYYVNLVKVFYFNATTKFLDYEGNEPVAHIDRCDLFEQHAMDTKINEHAINKRGFVLVNTTWVHKKTINELDKVRDEGNEDTNAEPSVALSADPSVNPNVTLSCPPMSIAFDSEKAFTQLLSYMESMDARVVTKLDIFEV
ncbi:Uncharacterized protein TCM_009788 [Theobroma cacao]|uniref:Uncharacterized protein n=1 Tax=Theobroma cacao TaxID=3641 RepID=A0A061E6E1_THECC|nr:Uncharacterized protein TCM_009788 [Theobroma cacao]